jgi:hypothetical protein
VASQLGLTTSGTGSTKTGASSGLYFDLFARGGDLTGSLAANDRMQLTGLLDPTAGGTLFLGNPTGLTGFSEGDMWKLFDLASGSITPGLAVDYSALNLNPLLTGSFNPSTGVLSINAVVVPEPGRAMLLMLSLTGLALRRRR